MREQKASALGSSMLKGIKRIGRGGGQLGNTTNNVTQSTAPSTYSAINSTTTVDIVVHFLNPALGSIALPIPHPPCHSADASCRPRRIRRTVRTYTWRSTIQAQSSAYLVSSFNKGPRQRRTDFSTLDAMESFYATLNDELLERAGTMPSKNGLYGL